MLQSSTGQTNSLPHLLFIATHTLICWSVSLLFHQADKVQSLKLSCYIPKHDLAYICIHNTFVARYCNIHKSDLIFIISLKSYPSSFPSIITHFHFTKDLRFKSYFSFLGLWVPRFSKQQLSLSFMKASSVPLIFKNSKSKQRLWSPVSKNPI